MTLIELHAAGSPDLVGAKASNLGILLRAGFPVPPGWVVPVGAALDDALRAELAALPEGRYAVRSSGQHEDLAGLSFAGQYQTLLDVSRAELPEAVAQCLASVDGGPVRAYLDQHHLDAGGMAVIVQQLIPAGYAGVAFTLNPLTGADTELVIEYTPGLGEALVSGQVEPLRGSFDWMAEGPVSLPGLDDAIARELVDACVAAQQLFGFPLDIEFAITDRVWLLQARPVTRITHTGLDDVWTTADFKDGGVSAGACKQYMWSLYEYIWEHAMADFLVTSKLIEQQRLRKLGRMFYGRPYWNLSVVKEVMARVPGYCERDFDEEFGIQPNYDGPGERTRTNPATLLRLVPAAWAQHKFLAEREAEAPALAERLAALIERRLAELPTLGDLAELERAFRRLTQQDYLFSESTYFWQIFLNTIHQSLFRDSLGKVADSQTYLQLLGGLDDVSHTRPFRDLWALSRRLRRAGRPAELADLDEHLSRFGYHSDKELDVSHPNYWEQPEVVLEKLQQLCAVDSSHAPELGQSAQYQTYQDALQRLRQAVGSRKARTLRGKVERMRELLWWREEFRDYSTRMYDVIRRYTMALGREYEAAGFIADDDIWYVPVAELWHFAEDHDVAALRQTVARNRRYYNAYRNHLSENEIGPEFHAVAKPATGGELCGIGCSVGQVTGTARVIDGLEDIGRLRPGDILVTRFTDTGWTEKFALVRAVVTEYGGMLCHAAIVSREYGVPCVVALKGATSAIRDGATICVDGGAGLVEVAR
jgi:pyruvate,water dikinase